MDFRLPELGEGIYEAELGDWRVEPGQTVRRGQTLMEVITDKAVMEVPSPFAGAIGELKAAPGDQVQVGQVVLTYAAAGQETAAESEGNGSRREPPDSAPAPTAAPPRADETRASPTEAASDIGLAVAGVQAAPSVRRMARALGIDLAAIRGSGPGGRILIDDLATHAGRAEGARPAAPPRPVDYGRPGTRVRFHGLRRKIAEHMVRSKRTIPHYSYVDECDVTDLVRLRESLKEPASRAGVRLTYLAFIVKAAAAALQEVPIVNSSLDEEAGEIVLHDRYDIGIATATPQGLLVPVVRGVDHKDVFQIARDIGRLSVEAAAGKGRREDLQGSTFTVTSIGGIGGLISTPVINHPEAAILGVGRVVRRPVYDETGGLRPADLVYLSFSFDHRLIDGAVGAAFANAVLARLKQPATLLVAGLDQTIK